MSVSAQVPALVGFDDLTYGSACSWGGSPSLVQSGYDNLNWGGFNTLDLTNLFGAEPGCHRVGPTGYSKLNTFYVGNVIGLGSNPAWLSSSNPFTLTSLVMGAGWQNGMTLTLGFWLNGQKMDSKAFTLHTDVTGADATVTLAGLYNGPTDYIDFTPDYATGFDQFNSFAESCAGAGTSCVPSTYKTFFVDNLQFVPAQVQVQTITPEPATVGLVAVGLLALVGVSRKRRNR